MKKKLLIAITSIVLMAFMVGSFTYAVFSDTLVIPGGSPTAAAGFVIIDAQRDKGDAIPGPMFYVTSEEGATETEAGLINGLHPTGLWMPGKTVTRLLSVYNQGTLAAKLNGVSAVLTGVNDPLKATEFANRLNVKIWEDPDSILYDGPLANLLNGVVIIPDLIMAANPDNPPFFNLSFKATLDKAAGNDLQGITPLVEFFIYAEQR